MRAPQSSADGLIVLLPETPGQPWYWWRVGEAGVGRDHAFDPATETVPWGDAGPVIVLVPATAAPVIDKPLPDIPVAQALAAERLALAQSGLVAQRHLAVAAHKGRLLSCSLAAADMDGWLAELAQVGLDPAALVPAALLLPRGDGALVLGNCGGQLLARTPQAAFTGEAALVDALTDSLEQVALDEGMLAQLLGAVHAAPPLNLRQGIYAPRRVSVFLTADWLGLGRMAATAALLALLVMVAWIVRWNMDSSAQEAQALELVQARFPAATDLDGAERMLNAELAKRGQGGASFAAPAAALLDAVRPVPAVKLRDMGYSADGTLRFTAAAPRAEDVNAVLIALQNEGWKVTVPPALAPDPTGATVAAITLRAP